MKFSNICKMSQERLKKYLTNYLKTKYNNVTNIDGFLYAKGTFPVLLVAHMDTVHKETVQQICYEDKGNKISSPQGIGGDDRCGIYMILRIIESYNCSVLFTEDEEIGCVGAMKFTEAIDDGDIEVPEVNYIIELDRKGSKDAVFYECENIDFENFIFQDKGWKLDYGSYTDIVEIAPYIGAAAVNFSCGYYNAHTTKEYVLMNEMQANIEKIKNLLARTTEKDKFEFIEAKHTYYRNSGWLSGWYESEEYEEYYENKTYYFLAQSPRRFIEGEVYAITKEEAYGKFLLEHPDLCVNDIIDFVCED